MKYVVSLFLIPLSLLSTIQGQNLTTTQIAGQLNTITTAVPFLLIAPDTRAASLGDAGCASSPDIYSNYWNAAKYPFTKKKNGIAVSWVPWLRALVPDINLFSGSFYKKIGKDNAIGFSAGYFSLGTITFFDNVGNTVGQFRPSAHTESISYSARLRNNISAGCALKYIHSNPFGNITMGTVQTQPGESFAMDLSFYGTDSVLKRDWFSWGMNISNVGQKIYYSNNSPGDFIPANLKLGSAYIWNFHKDHTIELILDATKLLVPTPPVYGISPNGTYTVQAGMDPNRSVFNALYSSFYDAPGGFKEELHEVMIASGIEYWCFKIIALRTGYFYEHETKGDRKYITAGIGIRFKGVEADGSYLIPTESRHPLQNTMRLTLSWEFDTHKKSKDKKPQNFIG